jgi:hypothetical protein
LWPANSSAALDGNGKKACAFIQDAIDHSQGGFTAKRLAADFKWAGSSARRSDDPRLARTIAKLRDAHAAYIEQLPAGRIDQQTLNDLWKPTSSRLWRGGGPLLAV